MSRAAPFAHRNLPLLLLRAREAVMRHRRPSLRAQGLSDQQWRVLRVLAEHTEGLETGQVAREAHLLGPSLTGVLVRMARDGWVTRERSAHDARRSVVRITAEGQTLVCALSADIEAQYADLERHLGRARLTQLYGLLDELIALQEAGDECAAHELLETAA